MTGSASLSALSLSVSVSSLRISRSLLLCSPPLCHANHVMQHTTPLLLLLLLSRCQLNFAEYKIWRRCQLAPPFCWKHLGSWPLHMELGCLSTKTEYGYQKSLNLPINERLCGQMSCVVPIIVASAQRILLRKLLRNIVDTFILVPPPCSSHNSICNLTAHCPLLSNVPLSGDQVPLPPSNLLSEADLMTARGWMVDGCDIQSQCHE